VNLHPQNKNDVPVLENIALVSFIALVS
jgi:hypothetical protein